MSKGVLSDIETTIDEMNDDFVWEHVKFGGKWELARIDTPGSYKRGKVNMYKSIKYDFIDENTLMERIRDLRVTNHSDLIDTSCGQYQNMFKAFATWPENLDEDYVLNNYDIYSGIYGALFYDREQDLKNNLVDLGIIKHPNSCHFHMYILGYMSQGISKYAIYFNVQHNTRINSNFTLVYVPKSAPKINNIF